MAKGFRRQGEWQVGFTQRKIADITKKKLEEAKLLEKSQKEQLKNYVANANEQAQEEQRQTNNIIRVSNYEAQLASNFSNTLRDLLTNTVPSLAKDAMDYNRAAGAAARMEEELEVEPPPDEEEVEETGFDAVKAAGDQQLDITKTGNDLATKLENSNDPFGKEKARKVRGIFSGAFNYGYEVRDKALKVEGFSAHFDNELRTNSTQLVDNNGVQFAINDPNLTKNQLAVAGNYILGKWRDENRSNLSDISVDKLLVQPARKVLKTNLKERFTALDNEFAASQVEGTKLLLTNSLDNVPGAPELSEMLNSYVSLVRPHLKATKDSSIGNQAITQIEDLIKDAFARSKNPDLLHKRLNYALSIKSDTPAGFKSLADLHPNRFSTTSITMLKQFAVSENYRRIKSFQTANVQTSVSNYIQEQRDLPKEERATESDKLDFAGELLKNNPLASKEALDNVSRLFIDPVDGYDTVSVLKGKIFDNGALTAEDILDPTLDPDVVKAYLEEQPNVQVLDQLYPESEKKDVEDQARSFEKYLVSKSSAYTIDVYGNVQDSSGTFGQAYTRFMSEIKNNAYKIQAAAKNEGQSLTFGEALREADRQMRGLINAGITDKNSPYYVNTGGKGIEGGFQNVAKDRGFPAYLKPVNVKEMIAEIKANDLTVEDQITEKVELDDGGMLTDPNVARIAQIMKVPEYDFSKYQSKAFGLDFGYEAPINYEALKDLLHNSEGANVLSDLQSKGNTSIKAIDRTFNDFYGLNHKSLTNAWKGMNFESVIRNEVTAKGLELDAGELALVDGKKHVGHALVGITDKFGIARSDYGIGNSLVHTGVDIGTTSTPGFHTAFNMQEGVVVANASHPKYGVHIDIQDKDGVVYRFAHLKNYNPALKVGAPYNGEVIGEIGNTGASTSEHLHFEKIVDGKQIDPTEDLNKLTIGKRIEPTIGKYPITKRMLARLAGDKGEENPIRNLNIAKAIHRYKNDELVQKDVWDYLNKVSWNAAMRKSKGDTYMATRYHVAYILRGDMDLYNLPTIRAFSNKYIHKLRTQGILD
jgi:murein DD-endopeptidase MepM/ murein hydrolase activator NlpD